MKQLLLDILVDVPSRFEHFLVGANVELVAALHEAALAGSDAIYLWGQSGSGKSHLLQAAVALAGSEGRRAKWLAGGEVGSRCGDDLDLLAIDDVETLSAEAQVALFNAFNRRQHSGLTLLLTGRSPPGALKLREDLRTRVGQCLCFEISPLDDTQRREIIMAFAKRRGFRIDTEVMDFILRHGRRDLPSLLSVIQALDAASLEQQRPITLPLLRSLIQTGLEL